MPDEPELIVYEPEQRARLGVIRSWYLMASRLVQSWNLVGRLFRRDLLAASQHSALGLAWIFISPLVGIASWVFMSRAGVLSPGDITVPYPLFVLIGTTTWGVFMAFFASASASLTSNGSLILHAKFSHEALVAQQAAQALVSVTANLAVLSIAFLLCGVRPHWASLFFPLSLVPMLLLGTGLGMFVAIFAVLVHDVTKVVGTLLGLLMFVTPVIYSPNVSDQWLEEADVAQSNKALPGFGSTRFALVGKYGAWTRLCGLRDDGCRSVFPVLAVILHRRAEGGGEGLMADPCVVSIADAGKKFCAVLPHSMYYRNTGRVSQHDRIELGTERPATPRVLGREGPRDIFALKRGERLGLLETNR